MTPWLDSLVSATFMPVLLYQTALTHALDCCEEQATAWKKLWESVAAHTAFAQGTASRRPEERDLFLGKSLSKTKTVTDLHTIFFGVLSQDFNPLHFNEKLARGTRFGGRIAHGFHTASLFTGVLSELTPWCVYLHQEMDFVAPVRPGDAITATGTIEEIDARGTVHVALVCRNQRGEVVVRGRALVKKLREVYQGNPGGA